VPWRNFRVSPARTWQDVRWIAFDWYLTKSQLKNMFPGVASKVPLDAQTSESFHEDQEFEKVPSVFKRAYVREIWDKKTKQVIFIAPSYKEAPLRVDEDPLNLAEFWPTPKPLYSIKTNKSLIPIPDFYQYASQAKELDLITKRIRGLIRGMKLRGFYDATMEEMSQIDKLSDNQYMPIVNATQWSDKGGIEKAIMTMPIAEAAAVLAQLYQQRDQITKTIFEITGLSDIVRGVSNPHETARAQDIKAQFGSLRINRRQREVQRYARDLIRIMVEIIAENFQPRTLEKITQRQVTPEMLQIMKSDELRSYRIDIETDSTIARQLQDEEENYTKLLNSIGQFVQMVAPMVAQGFMPLELAVALLQSGIRRFKMGRSVEEVFENIDIEQAKQQLAARQQQEQQQGNPEAEAKAQELQMKTQEVQATLQLKAQELTLKQQDQQSDNQIETAKLELEREKAAAEIQLEREKVGLDREKATADVQMTAQKNQADQEFRKEKEIVEAQQEFMGNFKTQMEEAIMADVEGKLGQLIQAMAQNSSQQNDAIAQAVTQMAEAVEKLNQPKKIIKDKQGRPIGVETVDKG